MRHGWFEITGIQTGERTLKEAIIGLAKVAANAKDSTILDLGCAEGLIGKWLIDAFRARLAHGLEIHPPYLEMARELHADYEGRAIFFECDLDHFDVWRKVNPDVLLPRYDIVLALRVIQKLARPATFLKTIAAMTGNILALNLPEVIIDDARSGNEPVDPVDLLKENFKLIDQRKAKLGNRMIFQRVWS